jgi:hypothetical protein
MLNEKETKIIYKFSKRKYKKIVKQGNRVYEKLINDLKLGDKERKFFDLVESAMLKNIIREKEDVFKRKLWEDGWMRIDPYFLPCFKPIFPLVYVKFYKKGTNTTQLKKTFSAIAINESFKEVSGRATEIFLNEFSKEGTKYYTKLAGLGILKKFQRRERELKLEGIPKGVVYDILRYMRKVKEW